MLGVAWTKLDIFLWMGHSRVSDTGTADNYPGLFEIPVHPWHVGRHSSHAQTHTCTVL